MPRNTKKAEREALHKARRKMRLKNKTRRASKRPGPKGKSKSHPHRRTSALRARR